ncbi:MAG: PAS domain S-box protein [Bryobacteraceae bacterium]
MELTGAGYGNIQLLDPASDNLRMVVAKGVEEDTAKEVPSKASARAVHSAPMESPSGKVLGTMCIHHGKPQLADTRTLRLFEMFAHLAAEIVELGPIPLSAVTWLCQPAGLHVKAQPSWIAFSGQTAEEILGAVWLKAVHVADAGQATALWNEAVATGKPFQSELRILRRDGQWRWMSVSAVPVSNIHGEIVEWLGVNLDITERRTEKEQLRSFVGRAPVAVAMFDGAMCYLAASKRWEDEFGLTERAYIGQCHHDLVPDRSGNWQLVHAGALAGGVLRIDDRHFRTDGSERWIRCEAQPWLAAPGAVGGTVIFAEDITADKLADAVRRSEDLIRRTLNALPAHVAVLDCQGRILTTNQAWDEFAARNGAPAHPSVSAGANYLAVCRDAIAAGDHSAEQALRGIENVLSGRSTQFTMEYSCHCPREQRWFQMTVVPMDATREGSAVVTHLNITERKRAEIALRDTEARLSHSLEISPAGILLVDAEGKIRMVNSELSRLSGHAAAELIGQPIETLVPDELQSRHARLRTEYMKEPMVCRIGSAANLSLRRKDGSLIPVEIALSPNAVFEDGVQVTAIITDISERVAAEQSLRERDDLLRTSEERYRNLAEQVADGIFIADSQGHYLDANHAACQMFGYTLEELRTRQFEDLLAPMEHRRIAEHLLRLRDQEIVRTEWRFRRKDGSIFVGEVSGRRLPDGRYFGAMRDVTERKLAQERLRESEERLRLAVESAQIGLVDWDLITGKVYFSSKWKQQIGYRDEEIGDSIDEWQSRLHPEDRETTTEKVRVFAEGPPGPLRAEYRLRHKDGSYRWMYALVDSLRNTDGKAVRILGCHIDVTERKRVEEALRESEERLRLAVSSGNIGLWDWDLVTNKVRRTPEWKRQIGYEDEELGDEFDDWTIRVHPEDIEPTMQALRNYLSHATDHYRWEYRLRHKDGSYRHVYMMGGVYNDQAGKPVRMLGCDIDITDRKKAEEALREEDKRKDEFLALLGHELRNPLAAISTAQHLLATGVPAERREELIDLIGRQSGILRRLVDELLDLSRITQGKIDLRRERVDLADLLQEASAATRSSFASRGQELLVRLPAGYVQFLADPVRLEQVVTNLLSNASKYTQRGGTIELSGTREGSEVVICCKDNGQGIQARNLERIFEPFTRGRETVLGYGEPSLGIGLALVKRLVELHGGTVHAESAGPGNGSEFTVRLPLLEPQVETKENGDTASSGRRLSIVLVEDNVDVAQTMATALEQTGHEVTVFGDGPSALSGLASARPDAILVDIGLPGMNGYELAERLNQQANLRQAVFVALSGHAGREPAEKAGFAKYFVKPVAIDELTSFLAARACPGNSESGLRVLLVEDNAELAEVTAEMLRQEQLVVRMAQSGQEALEIAARFRPDLALCDWHLPDMPGWDVVQRIRSNPATRGAYVVILSGQRRADLAALERRAKEMGIDQIISKPLLPNAIRDMVRKAGVARRVEERQSSAETR